MTVLEKLLAYTAMILQEVPLYLQFIYSCALLHSDCQGTVIRT